MLLCSSYGCLIFLNLYFSLKCVGSGFRAVRASCQVVFFPRLCGLFCSEVFIASWWKEGFWFSSASHTSRLLDALQDRDWYIIYNVVTLMACTVNLQCCCVLCSQHQLHICLSCGSLCCSY